MFLHMQLGGSYQYRLIILNSKTNLLKGGLLFQESGYAGLYVFDSLKRMINDSNLRIAL